MEVPKDQIATLMEHGLYDYAEILGCFLVSSSTVSTETSPHLKAENSGSNLVVNRGLRLQASWWACCW
ncbi:Anaphase-promoting complex subunit 7 [Cardamine amara subsp. amara]|uniref:Anaphase-promoting complex subunit 7 n=1 Tax=Cardamine amara subsp. amara TaxID=228776 RepID=A0ABD0Z870_CARAN